MHTEVGKPSQARSPLRSKIVQQYVSTTVTTNGKNTLWFREDFAVAGPWLGGGAARSSREHHTHLVSVLQYEHISKTLNIIRRLRQEYGSKAAILSCICSEMVCLTAISTLKDFPACRQHNVAGDMDRSTTAVCTVEARE